MYIADPNLLALALHVQRAARFRPDTDDRRARPSVHDGPAPRAGATLREPR